MTVRQKSTTGFQAGHTPRLQKAKTDVGSICLAVCSTSNDFSAQISYRCEDQDADATEMWALGIIPSRFFKADTDDR